MSDKNTNPEWPSATTINSLFADYLGKKVAVITERHDHIGTLDAATGSSLHLRRIISPGKTLVPLGDVTGIVLWDDIKHLYA